MSEAELHFIKARLRGGVLSKARRGELMMALPVGLVYNGAGHVVLDPDTAVRAAVAHLFATFEATGSATACVKAFTTAGLSFPWRHLHGPRKGELDWQPLRHHTVLRILHNPRYAGAFTYGRRRDHKTPDGRYVTVTLPREQWFAFIPGAHAGYITLEQYDTNLARLTANAAAHGRDRTTGPAREGAALLQGITICGRCGNRMTVRYHTRSGRQLPTYLCQREGIETAQPICTALPGHTLDDQIGALLLAALTPLTIEAAFTVTAELTHRAEQADALRAAHIERARYHAQTARSRYLSVDPANRLVADTLEADWNTALRALNEAQHAYDTARHADAGHLTDTQKARIAQLASDLPAIWNDPATPARERKRITRLLITDVTVTRTRDTITAHVRLAGGQHHTLTLPVPKSAWEQRQTNPDVVAEIDQLLDHHTHAEIADILNQRGRTSGEQRPFHPLMVRNIRDAYQLRPRQDRLRDQGLLPLPQMAAQLGVSISTVKIWYHAGLVGGQRYNDKGQVLYQPPGPTPPTPHRGRRHTST